jgi:hypothetical protein
MSDTLLGGRQASLGQTLSLLTAILPVLWNAVGFDLDKHETRTNLPIP